MAIAPGTKIGPYTVETEIGRGGMGVVYEATDTRLGRKVAIKVLPPELTQDAGRRERFQQEARLAAAFNHPNIATVHDVGEQDGVTFLVMELVRGDPLRELVRGEALPVERTLEIAAGVAAGLARAHREGVLHRDLKPDNVMLTDDGISKILDFGLGKLIGDTDAVDADTIAETVTSLGSPHVTRAGEIVGTLAYMSPEQVRASRVWTRRRPSCATSRPRSTGCAATCRRSCMRSSPAAWPRSPAVDSIPARSFRRRCSR
jgi:serine/threonine protein kinase